MLDRILIDSEAFADQQQTLQGSMALQDLDERVWSPDFARLEDKVSYTLKGGRDVLKRLFLQLSVSGNVTLNCQRCMQPFNFEMNESVRIVLFENEEKLDQAMLADEELEGMVVDGELDVFALLEDQILMALPFSPKHDECDGEDLIKANQDKPNPFAALVGVKKSV